MAQVSFTFGNTFAQRPAQPAQVESGCTVDQFLATQGVEPSKVNIRVGREGVPLSHVLKDGDYLTVSPKQVKGA